MESIRMTKKTSQPGIDGRARDANGEIRHKNRNTQVGTLRQTYGGDFAVGTRSNAKLSTVLDRAGADSLSEYLKKQH
jgi:hypothetical protein